MSKPLKPQAVIAIIALALVLVGLIGYKNMAANNPGPRTDAAHQKVIADMAAARAAGKGGKPVPPQSQNPPPAGH